MSFFLWPRGSRPEIWFSWNDMFPVVCFFLFHHRVARRHGTWEGSFYPRKITQLLPAGETLHTGLEGGKNISFLWLGCKIMFMLKSNCQVILQFQLLSCGMYYSTIMVTSFASKESMHKTKLDMINLNLQTLASCRKHFHHLGICITNIMTGIETRVIKNPRNVPLPHLSTTQQAWDYLPLAGAFIKIRNSASNQIIYLALWQGYLGIMLPELMTKDHRSNSNAIKSKFLSSRIISILLMVNSGDLPKVTHGFSIRSMCLLT